MIPHLRHSRITKVLTDGQDYDFEQAEDRLRGVRVGVTVAPSALPTAAGQAAALTALVTSKKCFGHVSLASVDHALLRPLTLGDTLHGVAKRIGADLIDAADGSVTHWVSIGPSPKFAAFHIRCWWNRWRAGIRPSWDQAELGDARVPLAGVVAAALGVRSAFTSVIRPGYTPVNPIAVSVWEPWSESESEIGPEVYYLPPSVWIVGLGHLGQGYAWSLAQLAGSGDRIVLQDYQRVGDENVATGLVTEDRHRGWYKTRVASEWLEAAGWQTNMIERRFGLDVRAAEDDPPVVLSGLHDAEARIWVSRAGFPYMVDAGVGREPTDFETAQIRVLRKHDAPTWGAPSTRLTEDLLQRRAYRAPELASDRCGAFDLANASIAVPFVGAAVGALTVAQVIRLASGHEARSVFQLELGAPSMVTCGSVVDRPAANIGTVKIVSGGP